MIFARDCASRSLRPDVNKMLSTISLIIIRSHRNDRIATSGAGSVNYRRAIHRKRARRETALREHFHTQIGRGDAFFSQDNGKLKRRG
jgi:hypothetical protein